MVKLRKIIRMCLSRILRMNPTGAHRNKSGNPKGNPNSSSTGDKSARRPPPAAVGGGAMASTGVEGGCKFGIKCTNMHCEFTDDQHRHGFKRAETCWKKTLGQHCNKCNPKEHNDNCQFGANCKYKNTTCTKVHPAPVPDSQNSAVQPVQVQPKNGTTTAREEQFPSLGGNQSAPVVVRGDWTGKNEDLSSGISAILALFPDENFVHLKESLEEKLRSFQTRNELLGFCKTLKDALARIEGLDFDSEELETLFKDPHSQFMTSCFGEGTMPVFQPEVEVFDRIMVFLDIKENLQKMVEKLELSQVSECPPKSGTSITEQIRFAISSIMDMMKQLPPLKQGDFQKSVGFLGVNDVLSVPPELVQNILAFATSSYNKIMDQIRIEEEERKNRVRLSLLDPKQFEVETTMTESKLMAMAYMFAISFMMGSNMMFFRNFVEVP